MGAFKQIDDEQSESLTAWKNSDHLGNGYHKWVGKSWRYSQKSAGEYSIAPVTVADDFYCVAAALRPMPILNWNSFMSNVFRFCFIVC